MELVMSDVTGLFKSAGALVGATLGVQAGTYGVGVLACGVLWPESNMCGLPAVFTGAAIGGIAGVMAGWLIAHRYGANLIAFSRRDTWMRNTLLFAFLAFAGIWQFAATEGTGASFRLWYWLLTIPCLAAISAAFGYYAPRHAWLWGAAPLLGQWLWVLVGQGPQIGAGNLGPFAHVVVFGQYALSAIPGVIAAEVAAYSSRSRSATART
jgi:hypothetical protein